MNREVTTGWSKFLAAFRDTLDAIADDDVKSAWGSSQQRTRLYADRLIPGIAKRLELKHWTEFLSVDHVLLDDQRHRFVYFIESENQYWRVADRAEELTKLCACRGEVGVLLTVVQWDEDPGPDWESRRRECLSAWRKCVAQHSGWGNSMMPIVALVGEVRDSRLRFYQELLSGTPPFDEGSDCAVDHLVYHRTF